MTQQPTQPFEKDKKDLTAREAYNIVTDIGGGINVRWRDNLYQAAFIFVSMIVGTGLGAVFMSDWLSGLFVGAFAGLLFGLFCSGVFLTIFRFLRHVRGRHD